VQYDTYICLSAAKGQSMQKLTQQTLLYLHLAAEICASGSDVIQHSVQKLSDSATV